MYTVLLADDELPILDTLKSSIHWQQFGVDTILTALDGYQALDLMKQYHIDLLITDIRMPKMDGLDLLKHVRSLYPDIHCIILSAYGEFEYARKSIILGVENYLLKPFQQEELEGTIEKALDNIYKSQRNNQYLFRDNILLRWVTGQINNEELGARSIILDINIFLPYYCVICIKKKNTKTILNSYYDECLRQMNTEYEIHRFWDHNGHTIFVIGSNHIDIPVLTTRFIEIAAEIQVQESIAISIGPVTENSDTVSESYFAAINLLNTNDLTLSGMLVFSFDNFQNHEEELLAEQLNKAFHILDDGKRKEDYQSITTRLLKNENDFNLAIDQLTHGLLHFFAREFPNKNEIWEQVHNRLRIFTTASAHEDYNTITMDLLEYSYLIFRRYFEQLSPIIQHAISYIQEHYAESLSIKEFCVKNKMNTAYIGFLFKKETGMFYNNYLMQYRILCSVQMLKDSDIKVNDIAKKVGFSSPSYFISCFRKQTGLSPYKYRSLHTDDVS